MSANVVAIFDKFRGTLSHGEIAISLMELASVLGVQIDIVRVSDGGEGFSECFDGDDTIVTVSDPFGVPQRVSWKRSDNQAIVEVAKVVGYIAIKDKRRPLDASSFGVGELLAAIQKTEIKKILVGCGGSITTDGGFGLVAALGGVPFAHDLSVLALVDTRTPFNSAPRVFAPQKGATPVQVALLERRFAYLETFYRHRFDRDLGAIVGSGAAGGVSGALWALGGEIAMTVDYTIKSHRVRSLVAGSDLVLTGEGYLDGPSLAGKVVGAVLEVAQEEKKNVVVIVGDADPEVRLQLEEQYPLVRVVSLVEEFGHASAMEQTKTVFMETISRYVKDLAGRH